MSAADKLDVCLPRITKLFAGRSLRRSRLFAASPWVSDEQRIARLVSAARLTGTELVLDIATGSGYIAEAFAKNSREVLGMDLTEAMLDIARARTKERGVKDISFRTGDEQNLPFDEGEFDVVVCRPALHHVQQPGKVVCAIPRMCGRCR